MPNCVFVGLDEYGQVQIRVKVDDPAPDDEWAVFHSVLTNHCVGFEREIIPGESEARCYLFADYLTFEKARLSAGVCLVNYRQTKALVSAIQDITHQLNEIDHSLMQMR